MKTKSIILLGFLFAGNITLYSQNYASMPVKEEFDAYNIGVTNRYKPCDVAADSDYSVLGDGMAYVLDAYVTMYKTTKDKAYLYNFILQSLCMMDNRHDFDTSYPNNEPRWSWGKYIYQDGNIIGAMAYFTYFVRVEEPNLYYEGLYPFEKLSDNMWNQTFTTFGQYADWLCLRVSETLDWFNTHSYWGNSGYKRHPEKEPAEINQQAGMGRALLFIGKAFSNTSYLSKAITILLLYKSTVSFYDACHVRSYDNPVFILNSSANAYWWYHSGWRVARECWNTESYEKYTEFLEDLSHGALTLSLVLDYYNCLGLFSTADMVRFRNTFTKLLYNGDGTFNNAVNGDDN
ncbi:MAG: hypothetical protein LBL18_03075, partial [Bacteroidales bacterium]|nr:hypothetical protein [Bacteroidales bacterium]